MTVTNGGLNAQGNWIWNVAVAADATLIAGGSSSLAVEAGFTAATANSGLLATPTLIAGTVFDTANPGNSPFAAPIAGVQNGIVSNLPTNQAFAAYGSAPVTDGVAKNFIQIVTLGPAVAPGRSLTSSVAVSGAYSGGARVAQEGVNYTIAAFNATRTAIGGDANLSGFVNVTDLGVLATHYQAGSGKIWSTADFSGDGVVDVTDLGILATFYTGTGTAVAASAAVPEPATIALVGLAAAAVMFRRRK